MKLMPLHRIVRRFRSGAPQVLSADAEAMMLMAEDQAVKHGQRSVDLHHVVLALLDEGNERFPIPFDVVGGDRARVRARVIQSLELHRPSAPNGQRRERPLPVVGVVKRVMRDAQLESTSGGRSRIGAVAILRQIVLRKWPPSDILREEGVTPDRLN